MTLRLQIVIGAMIALLLIYIIRAIYKGKIDMRYSLGWIFLCVIALFFDIFPESLTWLASISGIQVPSNMVFLVTIVLLIITVFVLTSSVSRLSKKNTKLIQEVGLLKKEIEIIKEKVEK